MDEKQVKEITTIFENGFNNFFEKKLEPMIGEVAAKKAKEMVESMKTERYFKGGRDITGLSEKAKKDFAQVARAAAGQINGADLKANEALIEEQDNRGGYLVSREVADAILRIAASVGTIMSQSMKWSMKTDELGIPNYTGAFLTGAYLGVDVAGVVTGLTFGQAVLIAKKWQLAFVVGNDLLADASVELADWLLALAGEALANMIDQQGFVGSGTVAGVNYAGPFVGILNQPTGLQGVGTNTTQYYAGNSATSGKTSMSGYNVMTDSSNMIGQMEESILDGAAFYMHRTVWAALRTQQDTNGNFILPFGGLSTLGEYRTDVLAMNAFGGPIVPAGVLLGFPVYTNRWLPVYTGTTVAGGLPFIIFGNFRASAFGNKGDMRVAQFESGAFGGKEIALADQRGIVYKHRHAWTPVLLQAFVVCYTSNS